MKNSEIEQILDTFSSVTGLNCVLVDGNYRPLADSGSISDDFCAAIHTSQKCLDCCMQSDMEAFAVVEKTKKTYIYTCPFGFFQAMVPVISGSAIAAYLIISLVAEQQPPHYWQQGALQSVLNVDPGFDTDSLLQHIAAVVMYPRQKLQDCTDALGVFAEYIASRLPADMGSQTLGEAVKGYIDKNLHKKITLANLSISLHCSTVTLTEHFRKEFGITIMQYVLSRRMELAQKLLADTQLPVKEISRRCGFADVEYFSRCFRDYSGNSPTGWREQKR